MSNTRLEATQETLHLTRRWLRVVNTGWYFSALLALTLFFVGVPILFQQLQTVDGCQSCGDQRLTMERLYELQVVQFPVRAYAVYHVGTQIALVLASWPIAALILWRKSNDRVALLSAYTLLLWSIAVTNIFAVPGDVYPYLSVPLSMLQWAGQVCFMLFFCLFPSGQFAPRWTGWLVVGWAVYMVDSELLSDSILNLSPMLTLVLWLGFMGSVVGVQIYRYRWTSNDIQRQQTRWVIFGVVAALGGFSTLLIIGELIVTQWLNSGEAAGIVSNLIAVSGIYLCLMLIPLSIGLAILRPRLWEIDLIICKTLIYAVLTIALAVVFFGSVSLLQSIVSSLSGQQSALATVLSTLAIAALFNPLRQRIQDLIDNRFYRRKYNAQQVLAAFAQTARDEMDLEALADEMMQVVEETMQPRQISLWLKE